MEQLPPFPDVRGLDIFPALESKTLEFKETFGCALRSRVTATIVSFLNAKGGYVVCGVEDRERKIVGLKATSTELDHYLRWFDDFYHGKRIVDSEGCPLTIGEVEAQIIEVVQGKNILVITVRPTPGKLYRTRDGNAFYRLAASVYKVHEARSLDKLEMEMKKEVAAWQTERDLARQHAARLGTQLQQAQARISDYKRAMEDMRKDTLAIIGAAKGLEQRLDLYVNYAEREILEKKAAAEAQSGRPWWRCW